MARLRSVLGSSVHQQCEQTGTWQPGVREARSGLGQEGAGPEEKKQTDDQRFWRKVRSLGLLLLGEGKVGVTVAGRG